MAFESFTCPTVIYRADFSQVDDNMPVELKELRRMRIEGLDEKDFKVEQVFYPSKDGTKIPMFVISSTDLSLNGQNPTLLNGYGGFNIARPPAFSLTSLMFVKHYGGVVANANIRGGRLGF